jgi:general secretion pathway protein J
VSLAPRTIVRAAPGRPAAGSARARRRPRRGAARGFTLVELLVAAALLAVLAVLSWRGLDAVLASRTRIVAASDDLRALTVAFAQFDEDLRRSWPVRLLGLPLPSIAFALDGDRPGVTLQLLREATSGTEPTQVQQVAWRLNGDRLERGFAPWVVPSGAAAGGFAAGGSGGAERQLGLTWQPVLLGVAAVQMQGWIQGQGWVAGEALVGQLAAPTLPAGGATAGAVGSAGAGTGAAGGTGAGTAGAGTATAGAGSSAAVTGMLVRVVRTDGQVVQRVFPVKD